jgi:hypothetical protein
MRGRQSRAGLELLRVSAAQAGDMGFAWWKAVALTDIGERLVGLGRFEEAEEPARQALVETFRIGERQFGLVSLALLARIAARMGRTRRAGSLWGAVETEEARRPVGQWEDVREQHAAAMREASGPDFEQGPYRPQTHARGGRRVRRRSRLDRRARH